MYDHIADELDVTIDKLVQCLEFDKADLTINLYKLSRLSRRDINELKSKAVTLTHDYITDVEVVEGYVNLTLDWDLILRKWKNRPFEARAKVVVDYSSPNIAKPMHVGHLRSTLIGQSICNVARAKGIKAVGVNWLGDIGTQFGKLIYAFKHWGNKEKLYSQPIRHLYELYVKFHEEAEKNPELNEIAKKINTELEAGEEDYTSLWKLFKELSLRDFSRLYEIFGIEFDEIAGESEFVEKAKAIVKELIAKGIAAEREDGSIYLKVEGEPTIIKKDGSTTYLARDLAAALHHIRKYDPDELIYVVANEQALHFKQLFTALKAIGVRSRLVHVSFGLVRLPEGKMSTRRGKAFLLEDLVKLVRNRILEIREMPGEYALQLAVNAIAYWMLKTRETRDIIFDIDKVVSFEQQSGVYCNYAYVRALKLNQKIEGETGSAGEAEAKVLKEVIKFPVVVENAWINKSPHLIANYLYSLAAAFNEFYEYNPVLKASEETRNMRILLVRQVIDTMEKCFSLLNIKPVKEM